MKERFVTLGLAVLAFALFYQLRMPKPSAPQEHATRPVTTEVGPNGYAAMHRWLSAADLQPLVLRDRYTKLDTLAGINSPTGNVLLTTAPHRYPVRPTEMLPLRTWIRRGNTLLVIAGLADTPEWAMGEGYDPGAIVHLADLTGLQFNVVADPSFQSPADSADTDSTDAAASTAEKEAGEKSAPALPPGAELEPGPDETPDRESIRRQLQQLANVRLPEPAKLQLVPYGDFAFLRGVDNVQAVSEFPASTWTATSDRLVMELAQNSESGDSVMWLAREGEGQVIVIGYGSVFTNKLLGEGDNAKLLANLIDWQRAANGRVILDDAHQGNVAFYDPQAFYSDRRLHLTLLFVVLLWLVFVLGPQRLQPNGTRWQPLDVTAFVRATGGYLARVTRPIAAAQQMLSNFFNDVRRQAGQPLNGEPLWDWLTARSELAIADVERLHALYGRAMTGKRLDVVELHNLLLRLRSRLQ